MRSANVKILETSLYVNNLAESEAFYFRLFGCPTTLADQRMRALVIAAGQILLLFARDASVDGTDTPGGHIPGHNGEGHLHLAFAIEPSEVEAWRHQLADLGIKIVSHVRPEQGGDSLYFRDPDGHLIELATPNIWNP